MGGKEGVLAWVACYRGWHACVCGVLAWVTCLCGWHASVGGVLMWLQGRPACMGSVLAWVAWVTWVACLRG